MLNKLTQKFVLVVVSNLLCIRKWRLAIKKTSHESSIFLLRRNQLHARYHCWCTHKHKDISGRPPQALNAGTQGVLPMKSEPCSIHDKYSSLNNVDDRFKWCCLKFLQLTWWREYLSFFHSDSLSDHALQSCSGALQSQASPEPWESSLATNFLSSSHPLLVDCWRTRSLQVWYARTSFSEPVWLSKSSAFYWRWLIIFHQKLGRYIIEM